MATIDITNTAPTTAAPFVRVLREAHTGNVLIALDPQAVAGLATILDSADLKEMVDNPQYLGLDADDAELAATVGYAIQRELNPYR